MTYGWWHCRCFWFFLFSYHYFVFFLLWTFIAFVARKKKVHVQKYAWSPRISAAVDFMEDFQCLFACKEDLILLSLLRYACMCFPKSTDLIVGLRWYFSAVGHPIPFLWQKKKILLCKKKHASVLNQGNGRVGHFCFIYKLYILGTSGYKKYN